MKTTTLFVTIILFISLSCSDDEKESKEVLLKTDYCTSTSLNCSDNYPLVVGYLKKAPSESYEITGTTTIESETYFVWLVNDGTDEYELYERMDGSQLLARYEVSPGTFSDEFLVINFDSDEDDEWEVDDYYGLGQANMKLESTSESLTIKGITFNNAIKVSVTFPNTPIYNSVEYYLPGLGFVKGYSTFSEFHLDGKIYIID